MDPATIAAGVVACLAPYLKKSAEEFAGEAGKYAQEKARPLWQKIRNRLESDAPAQQDLTKFEADPDAGRESLETRIQAKVTAEPALGEELSAALTEVKKAAPYVRAVQRVKEAEELVVVKARRFFPALAGTRESGWQAPATATGRR